MAERTEPTEPTEPTGAPGPGADDGGDGLTVGERDLRDAYAEFRRELEALPGAPAFQALVVRFGQQFGYRAVGRWISGRGPKAPRSA